MRLFTDGGARGNPVPAAAAFVLEREDGTVLDARGDAIGVQTNNVAEYTALLNGLRRAAELGVTEVEVVSDSELMVKQMRGEYKIKNAALRELSLEAARLARAVGAVTYTAVRREHNKLADQLVNDALDAAGWTARPEGVADGVVAPRRARHRLPPRLEVERLRSPGRTAACAMVRPMLSGTRIDHLAGGSRLLALALLLPR